MSDVKEQLTRSWLVKARHDLLSARQLARADVPLFDTASYHCQQAAEKAIKGFLLYHDVRFTKTHDVELLANEAADIAPAFTRFLDGARFITPLAVAFRYPGEYDQPEPEEFAEALAIAEDVYAFVLSLLPATCHPE